MKPAKHIHRRIPALLLMIPLLLSVCCLSACGSKTPKAASMHLAKAEGSVGVSDESGGAVELMERLGLYDGYQVGTETASYAWIDLDSTKLAKMDAESRIGIRKDGRDLEILVRSGGLFFIVSEPLEEDETMKIRTSNMMVGIRGTCGWVQVSGQNHMQVSLLEGAVICTVFDLTGRELASETISAGETASMFYDPDGEGSIQTGTLRFSDIPSYVLEETEQTDTPAVRNMLDALRRETEDPESGDPGEETSTEDPDGTVSTEDSNGLSEEERRMSAFLEILNSLSPDEAMYARLGDLNGDGTEDLLILGAYTFRNASGYGFTGYIWNGDGADRIPFDKTEFMNLFGIAGGILETPGYGVYRERSTGTVYVRYTFNMDSNVCCSFENAAELIPMDYEYDYEAPGAFTEIEQIFSEIQSRTDERFELLDSVSYQELYDREESLAATVRELKSQLSQEAGADAQNRTADGPEAGQRF